MSRGLAVAVALVLAGAAAGVRPVHAQDRSLAAVRPGAILRALPPGGTGIEGRFVSATRDSLRLDRHGAVHGFALGELERLEFRVRGRSTARGAIRGLIAGAAVGMSAVAVTAALDAQGTVPVERGLAIGVPFLAIGALGGGVLLAGPTWAGIRLPRS
jgi:hypothetical protein